jgi:hypothetical protein
MPGLSERMRVCRSGGEARRGSTVVAATTDLAHLDDAGASRDSEL